MSKQAAYKAFRDRNRRATALCKIAMIGLQMAAQDAEIEALECEMISAEWDWLISCLDTGYFAETYIEG